MEPASLALILGASAASSAASIYNNRQQIKYAQEANDETIGLANTAHQREVRDLIAAGLNPILSATSSGAATPSLRVPNLESIDGGVANNASGLARAVSTQQQLENDALDIDNGLQALRLKKDNALFDAGLNSARHEIARDESLAMFEEDLAMARQKALYDYMYGKDGWHVESGENGGTVIIPDKPARKPFMKDVKDSVKAEVKNAGTQYLQGWSNNIRGWVNTGIDAFNTAASFRRGGAMIRHAEHEDVRRTNEDIRRQERHEYFKRKWR